MSGVYTTDAETDPNAVPTRETYDAFQHAYDHFNWALFERSLPNCLITLQRKSRSFGYFSRHRFKRHDGKTCDEIALNPAYFKERSVKETLSTLVHEMVHLWQEYLGTPGRGRYHNRQWAEKMKALGLHPSHTGKPGGRELGDQMSHYILEGGAFDKAAEELIAQGFRIEWPEHVTPLLSAPAPGGSFTTTSGLQSPGGAAKASKAGKRIKYTCPECGLNAWSRHNACLYCAQDHPPQEMVPAMGGQS